MLEVIKEAILQNIGPLKSATKNWQKCNCRLCVSQGQGVDTRNRFGIQFNHDSIVVNCFNCRFSASYTVGKELTKSFKFFLKSINVESALIKQVEFEIFKRKNSIEYLRDGDEELGPTNIEQKFKNLFTRWVPTELPQDSLTIENWLASGLDTPEFIRVVNYAFDRKLHNLEKLYWSPARSNNLENRLIIPYYYRSRIVGFTSRICYDVDNKDVPKYYQQCPTDFVYNLDHQQDYNRKFVIVNEGVLDARATDGVGTLGELGQTKIDIINRLQKDVIVCPDRDKSGWSLVKAAIDNDWAVAYPNWDKDIKDAAQSSEKYGRLLTLQSIIASAVYGQTNIELKWKIEQSARMKRIK